MEKTNFFYLLGALLFMLVAFPLSQDLGLADMPLTRTAVFTVLLLSGVWSLKGGRLYLVGFAFVIIGIALSVLAANVDRAFLHFAATLAICGWE